MPTTGRGSTLGIGFETSAWGTAATRAAWSRMASQTISRTRTKEPIPDLGTLGAESSVHRSSFVSADMVTWNGTKLAYYNDVTVGLLEACLGKVATTGPSGSEYTHTITQVNRRDSTATADPLTVEAILGTSPSGGAAQAEVMEGGVVGSWEMSVSVGEVTTLSIDMVGQTTGGRTSAGTPTYAVSPDPILFSDWASPSYNSRTICARSIRVRGDNGLGERRCLDGTAFIAEPVVEGLQEITCELQIEYDAGAKLLHDDYLADVVADLTLTATGRGSRTLTMTLADCEIVSFSDPVSSRGVLLATVTLRATRASGGTPLTISIVNQETTARSNGPT